MMDLAIVFAFGCFGLALLCNLYRVAIAPGVPDRVLALDTMALNAIALIALIVLFLQWSSYAYLDKAKEVKRLEDLEQRKATTEDVEKRKKYRAEQKKTNLSWSRQTGRKEDRDERKEKKERKRQWEKSQAKPAPEPGHAPKRSRSPEDVDEADDDWDELAREERIAKKVKRGDVSQTEFDREFADL